MKTVDVEAAKPDLSTLVDEALSGEDVVLAKEGKPAVRLMPVDAGAKEEIYGVLRRIAAEGVGILLVSDDLLELIGLSNRFWMGQPRMMFSEPER